MTFLAPAIPHDGPAQPAPRRIPPGCAKIMPQTTWRASSIALTVP